MTIPFSPLRPWTTWAAAALLCCALGPANAGPTKTVSFTDASGDPGPVGDVVAAQLSFDNTGAWTATWLADPAHPFTGNVSFDLNLFDTALGTFSAASFPQVTLDGFVDFGAASATQYSYAGHTAFLSNWNIGDIISTGNGTRFESGAVQQDSPFGRDTMLTSAPVIGSVPEPASAALVLAGVAVMTWLRARRKRGLRTSVMTVW